MKGKVGVMAWLTIVVVLGIAFFAVLRYFRGSRVYVMNSYGYTAYGGSKELTLIPPDRFDRILQALVIRNKFDILHVSHQNDPYGGLILSYLSGKIELRFSFLRIKNAAKVKSFKQAMKEVGYVPTNEHPWNVGLGEDMEAVTLTYECKPDFAAVRKMTYSSLDLVDGPDSNHYYVYLGRSDDGPNGSGSGIKVVPEKNILDRIP